MPQIHLHKVLISALVFLVLLAAPASSSLLACPGFRWAERPVGALQQEEQAARQDTGKNAKKGTEQPGTEGGTAGKAAAKNDRGSTTTGAATNSKGAAAGGNADASGNAGAASHSAPKPRGASPAKKAQANQTAASGETAGTKGGTDGKASKPKAEASEKD